MARKSPKFLFSPMGEKYLKKMTIRMFTNEHELTMEAKFSTKKVYLKHSLDHIDKNQLQYDMEKDTYQLTLYDYLVKLKKDFECTFEFLLCTNKNIVVKAIHDKRLIDVIVLFHNK